MSPTKRLVCVFSLFLVVFASGCFGPFQLTTDLWEWNDRASDSKWVREAYFLGLNIIPVYGCLVFADAIVFNSIEFWAGGGDEGKPSGGPAPEPEPKPEPAKK